MKAIILTSQGWGSTFLQYCLDAHPSIRCCGEWLVGGHLVAPCAFLGRRFSGLALRGDPGVGPGEYPGPPLGAEEAPVVAYRMMYKHRRKIERMVNGQTLSHESLEQNKRVAGNRAGRDRQ